MRAIGMHGKLLALFLAGGSVLGVVAPGFTRAGDTDELATAPWVGAIRAMDEALAKGDVRAAREAREDARLAAVASRRWEGMAVLGDATLRLAQSAGLRPAMEPAARRAYLGALFRARRQASLDGVVRVTEALAALGAHDMARQGVVIATALAATSREPDALERVRGLQQRLSAAMPLVGGVAAPPAQAADASPTREGGPGGSRGAR